MSIAAWANLMSTAGPRSFPNENAIFGLGEGDGEAEESGLDCGVVETEGWGLGEDTGSGVPGVPWFLQDERSRVEINRTWSRFFML